MTDKDKLEIDIIYKILSDEDKAYIIEYAMSFDAGRLALAQAMMGNIEKVEQEKVSRFELMDLDE